MACTKWQALAVTPVVFALFWHGVRASAIILFNGVAAQHGPAKEAHDTNTARLIGVVLTRHIS
jgi:hypothetical protein